MRFRGAAWIAVLALAACAAPPGPTSPPPTADIGVSPSPTILSTGPVPSPSGASSAVLVRKLGQAWSGTFPLMTSEILERGEPGNCVKTKESERTIGEEPLKSYLATAAQTEAAIGGGVWLGTREGLARSLGSSEIVVPGDRTSRHAFIVLRVPEGSDIDAPAGSLAAIGIRRLDPPQGSVIPPGAELWLITGDLSASVPCL